MVFSDYGDFACVVRTVAASAFAVVVRRIGVEAGAAVVRVAFRTSATFFAFATFTFAFAFRFAFAFGFAWFAFFLFGFFPFLSSQRIGFPAFLGFLRSLPRFFTAFLLGLRHLFRFPGRIAAGAATDARGGNRQHRHDGEDDRHTLLGQLVFP